MDLLSRRNLALLAAMCLVPSILSAGERETKTEVPPPLPLSSVAEAVKPLLHIRSHRIEKSGSLTLELEVLSPKKNQALQIRTFIDGQPVPETRISASRSLALADQYTLTVPARRRDFIVTVIVQTNGVDSAPVQLQVRRDGPETRHVLRAILVGVGRYRDDEIARLRYPSKDATDLGAALLAQGRRIYREVHTRMLVEEQASRAQILEALQWLAASTAEKDTAVLFLAGHGTSDPDGTYYFLPHDAKSDKRTMLSGAELQAGLRGIAGRVVLLLDTCHAGNVLGRRSLTRLINELLTENRIVVLAASTGEQTSLESTAWRNGAFTKALIEGLRGAADYAEDGQIMLSELETWIGLRVKELTKGAQTPTLAKPNAIPDYVMAALPQKGVLRNPQALRRQRIVWSVAAAALGVVVLGGVLGARPWERLESFDLHFK